MSGKTIIIIGILLLMILLIVGIMNGSITTQNYNSNEMLIERLKNAYRKPILIGGEAILYQPKEDSSVRDEIRAKGREMVPYLVKGLHHKDDSVRDECACLLGYIPSKDGLDGLIAELLAPNSKAPASSIQWSLNRLTGYDKPIGPKDVLNPDIVEMRKIWLPWWEANKDRIVDTETGIGLKNDDETITPLPLVSK